MVFNWCALQIRFTSDREFAVYRRSHTIRVRETISTDCAISPSPVKVSSIVVTHSSHATHAPTPASIQPSPRELKTEIQFKLMAKKRKSRAAMQIIHQTNLVFVIHVYVTTNIPCYGRQFLWIA